MDFKYLINLERKYYMNIHDMFNSFYRNTKWNKFAFTAMQYRIRSITIFTFSAHAYANACISDKLLWWNDSLRNSF